MRDPKERAAAELERRKRADPLHWYAATPSQEKFLRRDVGQDAPFSLVSGLNRCLAPWQRVYDPMQRRFRRVDEVDGPWHVLAWDGRGVVVAQADRPYTKPVNHILRLRLSDGTGMDCSPSHLLLTACGRWLQASTLCLVQAASALPQTTWDICLQASRASDPHWSEIDEDFLADCRLSRRLYDPQLRLAAAFAPGLAPSPIDVPESSRQICAPLASVRPDDLAYTRAHSQTCPDDAHPSIQDGRDQPVGRVVASGSRSDECALSPDGTACPSGQQPARSCVSRPQRDAAAGPRRRGAYRYGSCASSSTIIIGADDVGKHQVWDFGVSGYENYIIGSAINHNSGKSMCVCADLALTLRGIHPHKKNYTNLTIMQFTPTRGQAVDVIGKKLFDDSELKLPPGSPKEAYGKPMIPAWEIAELNRPLIAGMRVPVSCTLKNGNRILFSWSGAADQDKRIAGRRLDAVYIDEEAGTPELFAEVAARLLDARSDADRPGLGYFVWAYTNTRYNEAYENFMARAEQGAPGHKTYVLVPGENPAVDTVQREMLAGLMTEDQANIRMRGGSDAGDIVSIYGKQWSDERHILPDPYIITPEDNLWVGYDPGVDHPMGMLVAAINKHSPLRLHMVQAWNYRGETIEKDANNLTAWLKGRKISGFVYDTNLKNRDRGGGPSVLSRFKELLAARGIVPMGGFYQSKKNHAPGIALVRHYFDPNPDDRTVPPLVVIDPPTPENGIGVLRNQILKYRGKESTKFTGVGGVVKKDDELGGDCIRYICMQRPAYNPQWACGQAVSSTTGRVANLYADDTMPAQKATVMDRPRMDFMNRVFLARRRDRAPRGGWSVGAV